MMIPPVASFFVILAMTFNVARADSRVFWYQKDPTNLQDEYPITPVFTWDQANDFCREAMGSRLCYYHEICNGHGGAAKVGSAAMEGVESPIDSYFTSYAPIKNTEDGEDEWTMITEGACGEILDQKGPCDVTACDFNQDAIPCCYPHSHESYTKDISIVLDLESIDLQNVFAFAREALRSTADVQGVHDLSHADQDTLIHLSLSALSIPSGHMRRMMQDVRLSVRNAGDVYHRTFAHNSDNNNALQPGGRRNMQPVPETCDCAEAALRLTMDYCLFAWSLVSGISKKVNIHDVRAMRRSLGLILDEFLPELDRLLLVVGTAAINGEWRKFSLNFVDLLSGAYNAFGGRFFMAFLFDGQSEWDKAVTLAFLIAQIGIWLASEGLVLYFRIMKAVSWGFQVGLDASKVTQCCSGRRGLLELSPHIPPSTRDPMTCPSPDTREFVVIVGTTVKGIYQGFDSAFEVGLISDESNFLVRRGIVEVTHGMAEDPRSIEGSVRSHVVRQDRGLTDGFVRYWKDESDVLLMMQQANNYLLINYQQCNDGVSPFSNEFFCMSCPNFTHFSYLLLTTLSLSLSCLLKPGYSMTNLLTDGGFEDGECPDWTRGLSNENTTETISVVSDFKLGGAQSIHLSTQTDTVPAPEDPPTIVWQLVKLVGGNKGRELIVSAYVGGENILKLAGVKIETTLLPRSNRGLVQLLTTNFSEPDDSGWTFSTSSITLEEDMQSFWVKVTCRNCGGVYFDNISLHWNTPTPDSIATVKAMYCRVLQRPPDDQGAIDFWTGYLRKGSTAKDMLREFVLVAPEFARRFVDGKSHETVAHTLYDVLLARAPDAGGLVHWTKELEVFGLENVVDRFLAGEEYNRRFGDHYVPDGGRAWCNYRP
jgi:hypothetical protein